ncbi:hypothetical protein [uncultured Mediterranean phage uvDeep-CGR2-KM18-C269]|jgi:hypothetical protein|nr:hypothetical protein [uncultured Mediterranean phage uvDeep-CGR2-KM18-C269]
MAITFTNVFKDKILDTVRTFINTEFAGTISVYTGNFKNMGNQSIRLTPVGNELVENLTSGEIRDYIVEIAYYFKEKALKRDAWEHILRQISRIENLFNDNLNNTYFNGRLVSMVINEKTEEEEGIDGLNVIKWEFRAMFLSNVS